MVRVLLGVLIAGSAMFGWGYVYWDILPEKLADAGVIDPVKKASPEFVNQVKDQKERGTYHFQAKDKDKVTLTGMIWLTGGGEEGMSTKTMAWGYAHFLLSALFLGLILKLASPSLKGYFSRLGFVFVLGVFAAVLMMPGYVIWWSQPIDFPVYNGMFYVTAAIIAGLFLAAFVRHEPRKARVPVRIR